MVHSTGLWAVSGPVAVNDENFGPEGIVLTGNLGENDFDPDGGLLTFSVVNPPSSGVFVLQTNGDYVYTPTAEFNGFQFITYRVCDDEGLCATAVLEIAMLFVNDLPTIVDDNFFVTQNTTLNNSVASNDFDIDIEPIFYTVFTPPAVGSVTLNYTTGQFAYTPPNGFLGTVTWQYYGCDPCGVCDSGLVTITIIEQNGVPVANDDELYGSEDEPITGNVSLNDSDPDGNALTYAIVDEPLHGILSLSSSGAVVYTPDANYQGLDEFTYSACDPFGDCDFALVGIYVSSVNDSPFGIADIYNGSEDQMITGNVGTNDFDVDIEPLFFIASSGTTNGIFTLSNNGSFTFVPNPNFFGTASAFYWAIDPCGFSSELTTVTFNIASVNDLPVAVSDQFSGPENEQIIGSVALNDSDLETSASGLIYQIMVAPVNGAMTLQMNGSFVYTPNLNFFGVENITYRIIDANGGFANAQLVIEVTSVNSVPTVQDESFTIDEDEVLSESVAANDVPEPGEELTYSVANAPVNGVLVLNVNGTFVYTPFLNFFGTEVISYIATDPFGASDIGQLTIIVASVDDPPVATTDEINGLEDQVIAGNVGINDFDVENDDLTWIVVDAPMIGMFVLDEETGSFTYTPDLNFNGNVEVIYAVVDESGAQGFGVLNINVLPVNDAPLAEADTFETNEDSGVSGSVADNDFDVDGDILSFTLLLQPSNGTISWNLDGSFSYTPNSNFNGTETLVYAANDDVFSSGSTSFIIQILPVNDAPIAVNDFFLTIENQSVSGTLAVNDSDADGNVLQYSVVSPPAWGSIVLNNDGSFVYTPALNFFGIVQTTYQISDGNGGISSAILSIAVQSVNSVPVAQNDNFNVLEDEVLMASVATNDSDVENDALNYSVVQIPATGTLVLQSSGSFVYTSPMNFNGIVSFTYMVSDGADTDTATVVITLDSVNDLPIIGDDAYSIEEDEVLSENVASNDSDVESAQLVYSLLTDPLSGTLIFEANGTFVYTPAAHFHGEVAFEYTYDDGNGGMGASWVYIDVSSVNDVPEAFDALFIFQEDQFLSNSLFVLASDADNDPLVFGVVSNPSRGMLVMQADGSFSFTPDANYFGLDSFVYFVSDGNGGEDEATVMFTIESANDSPVASSEVLTVLMNGSGSADLAVNDSDADDGDALSYLLQNMPEHGEASLTSTGFLVYTPDANFVGVDQLTYTLCDAAGACAEAVVSIEVIENNQIPFAGNDVVLLDEDNSAATDVSVNDTDPEGQALDYSLLSNGGLTGSSLSNAGLLTVVPANNAFGTFVMEYVACDPFGACSAAFVTVIVASVNDIPTASNAVFETEEDGVFDMSLSYLASDVEDEQLTFTLTSFPGHGSATISSEGLLVYIPGLNWSGTVDFTYSVCDAEVACATGTVQVEVNETNDLPVVQGETFNSTSGETLEGSVAFNDSDPDNNQLNYAVLTGPAFGTLSMAESGDFVFTTSAEEAGNVMVVYEVCDGQDCVQGVMSITVVLLNHPPVAESAALNACIGDMIAIPLDGLVSDEDESISSLSLTALNGIGGFLSFNDATQTVMFQLQDGFEGEATISYTVCDSGTPSLCASGLITIQVLPLNSPVLSNLIITGVGCFGESSGRVEVTAGSGDLVFNLSGVFSSGTWENLAVGAYDLTISSTALCSVPFSEQIVIPGPDAPLAVGPISVVYSDPNFYAVSDLYEVSGGTAPYFFEWFDEGNQAVGNSSQLQATGPGNYRLKVTDSNGCFVSVFVEVPLGLKEWKTDVELAVFPNPTMGPLRINMTGAEPENVQIELFDISGRSLELWSIGIQPTVWSRDLDISTYSPGIYVVSIQMGDMRINRQVVKP
jgi:large repetitive protein